jgi:hypothetical protein
MLGIIFGKVYSKKATDKSDIYWYNNLQRMGVFQTFAKVVSRIILTFQLNTDILVKVISLRTETCCFVPRGD